MKLTDRHPTVEVRSVPGEVAITTASGGSRKVTGYASVFNTRSQVLTTDDGDPFVERVLPGAFARSLTESDVRALFNHEPRFLLGRRGAGTLRLGEDSTGLHYEIDLGTRSYDRDLEESLDRKDLTGSSFSFATVEDDWEPGGEGMPLRSLKQVHVFDVGPVVFPAYRSATATCRSFKAFEARSAAAARPPIVYPTPAQTLLLSWFDHADL